MKKIVFLLIINLVSYGLILWAYYVGYTYSSSSYENNILCAFGINVIVVITSIYLADYKIIGVTRVWTCLFGDLISKLVVFCYFIKVFQNELNAKEVLSIVVWGISFLITIICDIAIMAFLKKNKTFNIKIKFSDEKSLQKGIKVGIVSFICMLTIMIFLVEIFIRFYSEAIIHFYCTVTICSFEVYVLINSLKCTYLFEKSRILVFKMIVETALLIFGYLSVFDFTISNYAYLSLRGKTVTLLVTLCMIPNVRDVGLAAIQLRKKKQYKQSLTK